jgi:hypothetical protein
VSLEPEAIDPSLFARAIRLLAGLPGERPAPPPADDVPG